MISTNLVSFDTHFVGVAGFEPAASCSQSRRDNRATLHPESFFLKKKAERLGLEPRRHLRVDRLAICSVTTPAPLQYFKFLCAASKHFIRAAANVLLHTMERNFFKWFLTKK